VLDDLGKAAERMNRLREHDLEFSMDDFGTGYSSLSYLRALPLSEVKIDKSYVSRFRINRQETAILRAVLNLCASLDIRLVARPPRGGLQPLSGFFVQPAAGSGPGAQRVIAAPLASIGPNRRSADQASCLMSCRAVTSTATEGPMVEVMYRLFQ
jgi:hypothetical protein